MVPHVFCLTQGVEGFRPNGASYPALRDQANGLGQQFRPIFSSRALKARDKDRQPSPSDRPPTSQNVGSPLQGLRANAKAFSDPGRWINRQLPSPSEGRAGPAAPYPGSLQGRHAPNPKG